MADLTATADIDTFMGSANFAAMRTALSLGTVALLASDTDGTLAANSDSRVATQKAVKTAIATAVTSLLKFQGTTDCSGNPNYPAAVKGDAYVVSVAGKIGGASGVSVAIGDWYVAIADNAGGTQAGVGGSWTTFEHNIPDLATIATTGSASDLSTGTVPDARFPATLPALSGVNLTALNASNLASGFIPAARIAVGLITDTLAALSNKPACMAVATTNLTLSGEQTIDGSLTSNSVPLLTGQTAPAENGPWVTNAGAWTRPSWYPSGGTVQAFQFATIFIRLGVLYRGSTWRCGTAGAITIDTTGTTWAAVPRAENGNTVIRSITTVADADKTATIDDNAIAYTSITATRTVTLPASAAVTDGHEITINDASGSVTNAIRIIIAAAGSDTIQGQATTWIPSAYGAIKLRKRGTVWAIVATADLIQTDVFTSSGTYTMPIWAKKVDVEVLGGGGGGGAGGKGTAGNARIGGGSGGGGAFSRKSYNTALISSPVTVTIGAGGTGGASQSTNESAGANGVAGGATTFGTLLRGGGGGLGVGGGANATGGTAGAAGTGEILGATGNNASATGSTGGTGQSATSYCAGGGGAGGGITTGDTASAGGPGGSAGLTALATGMAAGSGGAASTNGSDGNPAVTNTAQGGSGAGGGGGSKTTNGGNGGTGGLYGGGGGGGGAALNSVGNSGAGGPGAAGICVVRTLG